MNAALGNVGATVVYTPTPQASPVERAWPALRDAGRRHERRHGRRCSSSSAPIRSTPRRPTSKLRRRRWPRSPLRVHLGLLPRRDRRAHASGTCRRRTTSRRGATPAPATAPSPICQPLIEPLYDGRSAHEVVAALAGETKTPLEIVQDFWRANWDGRAAGAVRHADRSDRRRLRQLREVLAARAARRLHRRHARSRRRRWRSPPARSRRRPPRRRPTGLEVTFRADPTVYDGRFANNGWLQELPKPFDKVCWDNVAYISPRTAEPLGMTARKPVVYGVEVYVADLTVNGHSLQVPLWILPGQPDESITLHLGYGRTQRRPRRQRRSATTPTSSATRRRPWVLAGRVADADRRDRTPSPARRATSRWRAAR